MAPISGRTAGIARGRRLNYGQVPPKDIKSRLFPFREPGLFLESLGPVSFRPHLTAGLKEIHFPDGFRKIGWGKTAASPVSGHPAISLLETRGFPSPLYGGFCFRHYLY